MKKSSTREKLRRALERALGAGVMAVIRLIGIADLIRAADNIRAVAGASAGSLFLLLFGVGPSMAVLVMGAAVGAVRVDLYGWLVCAGAGALVGVEATMVVG